MHHLYYKLKRGKVILLTHPLVGWMEQCTCTMWVNVDDCTKINYACKLN